MRKLVIAGLLVVFLLATAHVFSREGLTSWSTLKKETKLAEKQIMANIEVDSTDILTVHDDPREMGRALLAEVKQEIPDLRYVSIEDMFLPMDQLENPDESTNWNLHGINVRFYCENVEKDGETVEIVRRVQLSPMSTMVASSIGMIGGDVRQMTNEGIRGISKSPPIKPSFDLVEQQLQAVIDRWTSDEDLQFTFDGRPYEEWDFAYSRAEAWQLRCNIAAPAVLGWISQRATIRKSNDMTITIGIPERGGTLDLRGLQRQLENKTRSMEANRKELAKIQQTWAEIELTWPAAYYSQYYANYHLPALQKEARQVKRAIVIGHWETPTVILLTAVCLALSIQLLLKSPRTWATILLEADGVTPSKTVVGRIVREYYRGHTSHKYWQPVRFWRTRWVIAPLCDKEVEDARIRSESAAITAQADDIFEVFRDSDFLRVTSSIQGLHRAAVDTSKGERGFRKRRDAINQMWAIEERDARRRIEDMARTEAKKEGRPEEGLSEEAESTERQEMIDCIVENSPSDPGPAFWHHLNNRQLRIIFGFVEMVKDTEPVWVEALFERDLRKILVRGGELDLAVEERSARRLRLLFTRVVMSTKTPAASAPEAEDPSPLAVFKKVVIIGGRKQVTPAKGRLVQAAVDLGAKKAEFVFSEETTRLKAMATNVGPDTLFIYITLAEHDPESILRDNDATWIRVNHLNSDRFKAEVRTQLGTLSLA